MLRPNLLTITALIALAGLPGPTASAQQTKPVEERKAPGLKNLTAVPVVEVPSVDREALRREDEQREQQGLAPRFAVPNAVNVTPVTHGIWEEGDRGTRTWRLRITSPGATSLNLGFTRYHMPPGGRLDIYSAERSAVARPFTSQDNEEHGELWTPVIPSDDIVIEVTLPGDVVDDLRLELTSVNVGYRGFGDPSGDGGSRSGACNVDVVCPEGDGWRDQISCVGVISTGGYLFCTGYMVNNTAEDLTPYFMTAKHCGISSGNASSLVVYWNYENSWCRPPGSPASGGSGDGSLSQYQTGSFYRSSYTPSDFTLVELDDFPLSEWNVGFCGWDRSGADASSAVAIHHPNTDEKRISFEYDPTTTTSYLGTSTPGDGTHVRITDWDLGTTEPGSSGSPLYDQNQRIIGQLHGGYASCTSQTSDWYGKFSVSWNGGGSSSTRLRDWLDPGSTGDMTTDFISEATLCSDAGTIEFDRTSFACDGTAGIKVVDCGLNTDDLVVETVTVTIASDSEPGGESVVLTETDSGSAKFEGTIQLSTTDAAGVLLVAPGDTVTATYIDADDGVGGTDVVVTATADVDCTAPQISNVQTTNIEPRTATVTFDSNEPARGTVHYGLSCGALSAAATGTSYDTSVTVDVTGLQEDSTYYYTVDAEDIAGNVASDDNGGACYTFATPDIPEYFTEEFVSDNDLDNLSITFTPNGSIDFYEGCAETITALPTDPSGGSSVILSDDDYEARTLSGGDTVSLYGTNYTTFYIGSNGFITFGGGDTEYTESLADHFSMPRISPLFDDFNPSTGGTVSWKQISDRAVVTWENVPEYGSSNSNTFQVEMFFSGEIRMSYLAIAAVDGIAGLSEGNGLDPDFYESDLSALGACVAPGDCDDDGDVDEDDYIVFVECFSGDGGGIGPGCQCVALDNDDDVDCRDWNLFGQLWSGPGDPPAFAPCAQPSMTAAGGRYLAVTPAAGSDPVALLITGDPEDAAVSCVSLYVQGDGNLDAAPLFLPPSGAGGWNTVYVHGTEVMPETTYNVQGDYGSPGSPSLSPARSATTWAWAEVEPNGVLNMTDIQWLVLRYEDNNPPAPFEACDIAPCDVDALANFTDVQWAVLIYEGAEYRDDMCTVPCL